MYYVVEAEARRSLTDALIDDLMSSLQDISPSLGATPSDSTAITVTLQADNLPQALATGYDVVGSACAPAPLIGLSALPEGVRDAREGLTSLSGHRAGRSRVIPLS